MSRRRTPRLSISLASLIVLAIALVVYLWQSGGLAGEQGRPGQNQPAALAGPTLLLAALDVGQGDAIVVKAPSGKSMLVDAGDGADDARQVILPFLKEQGISRLDYIVLTHPDQDHVGGIPSVLSAIKVDAFVDPVLPDVTNNAYKTTLELVREKRIKGIRARHGRASIDLGPELLVQVLAPEDPLIRSGASADNDNSVVLRLTLGKIAFLLTGDIERAAETRLLGHRDDIRSQILKIAHHGSSDTTTDRFLDAVKPEVALISAGKENRYGHPHRETLARLGKRGVTVYRTDLQGNILVRSNGETYTVETSNSAR